MSSSSRPRRSASSAVVGDVHTARGGVLSGATTSCVRPIIGALVATATCRFLRSAPPTPATLRSSPPSWFSGVAVDPILDVDGATVDAAGADRGTLGRSRSPAARPAARARRSPPSVRRRRSARDLVDELAIWARTIRAARLEDDRRPRCATAHCRAQRARRPPRRVRPRRLPARQHPLRGRRAAGAVIDWEIWSVGRPRDDLGWLVQFTDPGELSRAWAARSPARRPRRRSSRATAEAAGRDPRQRAVVPRARLLQARRGIQAHNRRRHLDGPLPRRVPGAARPEHRAPARADSRAPRDLNFLR